MYRYDVVCFSEVLDLNPNLDLLVAKSQQRFSCMSFKAEGASMLYLML